LITIEEFQEQSQLSTFKDRVSLLKSQLSLPSDIQVVRRQNNSILAKQIAAEEVAELTSFCEVEGDVSCNMQDISLLQLEKEWTETAYKLAGPKVNNFTGVCREA
jgi:hypothetical protein